MAWLKTLKAIPPKWRCRSWKERAFLLEAFVLLGAARLAILIFPFRRLAVTLGRHMNESGLQANMASLHCASMVGQAVCSAANNTPWKSHCLAQAVAGQWMLKRRRIAGTLYLGVAKNEIKPEKINAHAWLRCGNIILTGQGGHQKFTVVATFS
jgi:hypothetical protein